MPDLRKQFENAAVTDIPILFPIKNLEKVENDKKLIALVTRIELEVTNQLQPELELAKEKLIQNSLELKPIVDKKKFIYKKIKPRETVCQIRIERAFSKYKSLPELPALKRMHQQKMEESLPGFRKFSRNPVKALKRIFHPPQTY